MFSAQPNDLITGAMPASALGHMNAVAINVWPAVRNAQWVESGLKKDQELFGTDLNKRKKCGHWELRYISAAVLNQKCQKSCSPEAVKYYMLDDYNVTFLADKLCSWEACWSTPMKKKGGKHAEGDIIELLTVGWFGVKRAQATPMPSNSRPKPNLNSAKRRKPFSQTSRTSLLCRRPGMHLPCELRSFPVPIAVYAFHPWLLPLI
ncbi:hypothetical protein B0H19DRAFT_1063226 [Mycena capillaripes]|nr:hypothetical protein B0H19DRAFT_1063226 [Mycena capillaripes]